MAKKPMIGITLDWQKEGSFSSRPHYALREHWFKAVYAAGGLPVGIPHIREAIPEYLNQIDGLLVPGGEFAAPEEWYVASSEPMPYKPTPRVEFDRDIIEQALARDIPLLGVCAGMQFLGGIQGCKMTRNIQTYVTTDIDHWGQKPAEECAHPVNVMPGTLLERVVKQPSFEVNTHHREALVEVPDTVVVNATAPDGTIEGIELPHYKFALGVQWHPEYQTTAADRAIFNAFVAATIG